MNRQLPEHNGERNETQMKPIEMEDILTYRIPGNLTYSPEGKTLAFEVTCADREKNEYRTSVWLAENGEARQATFSLDASIALWEDETHLILRRSLPESEAGTTELFRLDIHGGEAAPWMKLPFAMRKIRKLGENRYVATGRIRREDPDAFRDTPEERKKKEEQRKEEKDYEVFDEIPYWFNGAGVTNGMRTALFLIQTAGGKTSVTRLTAADFDVDGFCAEEGTVYFCGGPRGQVQGMYNKVYAYDGKKTACLYRKGGMSFGGLFVMNGKLYGQASDLKTYGCNETPKICRIEDGKAIPVYDPPVTLYSSVLGDTAEGGAGAWSGKKEYLTLATIRDHNAIFRLTEGKNGLKCQTLWEQDGMACGMDACEDRIALVFQGWNHVAEVFEMQKDGTGMCQITHLNEEALAGKYVAEPRRIDYTSCGLELRGWVLLPEGYSRKKRYPAILDVHGGPRCAYGETFFHEMQVWASRGYLVFFTNIKGSDGRGDDFADIRGDYGGTDFQNLMDFTDAVMKAYPNIDPERVCETGGSYGGFMTNWIIGHTNRFCCAASQRSISNWVSFAFISDIGAFFSADQNGTRSQYSPEEIRTLWDHSPLKYADQVRTPTLFIHSDEDYRCPLAEGMQMMQAIAQRGVETRMCLFHGENHELSRSGKPKHRIRRLKEMTDWFDAHTKTNRD